jgi:hypothetical protein
VKNSKSGELIEAIYDLYNGGSPMSSIIARKVVQAFSRQSKPSKELENISNREKKF